MLSSPPCSKLSKSSMPWLLPKVKINLYFMHPCHTCLEDVSPPPSPLPVYASVLPWEVQRILIRSAFIANTPASACKDSVRQLRCLFVLAGQECCIEGSRCHSARVFWGLWRHHQDNIWPACRGRADTTPAWIWSEGSSAGPWSCQEGWKGKHTALTYLSHISLT